MAIDRARFFAGIRNGPFPGSLSQEAVRGITAILDEWERRGLTDLRWLAYMLATVLAECGRNMLPVREGFKATDAQARAYVASKHYRYAKVEGGQVYYGRGLVQLTWLDNYRKMAGITGLDLVNNPDLALEPAVAAKIMFEGMIRGTFTGKKLGDYFNATATDWTNARRIINGLDRAGEIAGYGKQFHADLVAADTLARPVAPPPTKAPTGGEATAGGAVVVGGGAVIVAASEGWGWMEWSIAGLVLLAVCAAALFGWRWWKARRDRRAAIDAAGTAAVAEALNSQTEGTPTWTGDQLPASSPPSLPSSELSSEQLSVARLALSSAASLETPSRRPSKPKRPRKQSAKPSRKTRKRAKNLSASKSSAVRKSSPRRKPKSRGRNSKG